MTNNGYHLLGEAIETILKEKSPSELQAAYKDLLNFYTARKYREIKKDTPFKSTFHRLAYIAARMPATYTVIYKIFSSLKELLPPSGCGSGSGVWAALQQWPNLDLITAVDQDKEMLNYAQHLLHFSPFSLPPIQWVQQKITPPSLSYDLILLSYVLNEEDHNLKSLLQKIWEKCNHTLIIIEPGTPKGFQQCLKIRHLLIQQKAHIIAPCGHEGLCPLQTQQDWCHFEERLERLSWQRMLKGGSLGYEDEAYIYLVASKTKIHFQPRIVRAPLKRKGHILVDLCVPEQLQRISITHTHPLYSHKKSLRWGKRFEITTQEPPDDSSL
jgi:ribosomal protein RSM22 (predicted rRNA methylase)